MAEFRMPSLGADMKSGTLLEWLVRPGDRVAKGDIIAVVDTQKAAIEVECFASGVVEQLLVEPGTRVTVGTALATIATEGPAAAPVPGATEEAARRAAPAPPGQAAPRESTRPVAPTVGVAPSHEAGSPVTSPLVRHLAERRHVDLASVRGTGLGGRITHADVEHAEVEHADVEHAELTRRVAGTGARRVKASPLARRLAAELGVGLETVSGTGPDGAIDADDVRRAAARAPRPAGAPPVAVAPAPVRPEAPADRTEAMRAAIAALMARSKREIPHYYLTETVDLGAAMQWLYEQNRTLPVPQRLVGSVLLLKATARAAATVAGLNGFFTDGRFEPAQAVHLGVAVSLRGGGLIAPAIHDADRMSVRELMAALRDLVARARAGRLRRAEMSDPTITVSTMGDQGAESILGVIYPPQVALVGFGKITDRPWAVDGLLGVRPTVVVSLAADHRVTDGATGARFLSTIAQWLSKPGEL